MSYKMERLKIKFMKVVLEFIMWEYSMGRYPFKGARADMLMSELREYEESL